MYSYIYIHAFIRDPNLGHAFSMTSQTSNRRHWYIHYIYISLASPAAPPVPHALPPTPYYYYITALYVPTYRLRGTRQSCCVLRMYMYMCM